MTRKNKSIIIILAGSLVCTLSFIFVDDWNSNRGLLSNITTGDIWIGYLEIPMNVILAIGIVIIFIGIGILSMSKNK